MAKVFNEHFVEIAVNTISEAGINRASAYCPDSCFNESFKTDSFFFETISSFEVYKVIQALDNSFSSFSNGISNNFVKKICLNIVDVLTHLFNKSVIGGEFPQSLKIAEIIPIFKKGDKKCVNDYRPISLLPIFSKIFEKIIKCRVLSYLEKIAFFSSKQYGFRAGKSTEDALLTHCCHIYESIDQKKYTAALYIDIKKAFDTVDHGILLNKLEKAGFRDFMLDWFASYLKNRKQKVKIGYFFSDTSTINIGVPQGSVLGPILFLVYINSIFSLNLRGKVCGFADDIACVYSSTTILDLISDINHDLELFRHWFGIHKLVISNKTRVMFFNLLALELILHFLFNIALTAENSHLVAHLVVYLMLGQQMLWM